ncbi:MAG: ZIP family metal transporter [Armatimonadetes bacterium]|nr:ZIP family metal transporter [Armatimonadota bacterium]
MTVVSPLLQALVATLFTCATTAVGAAGVFLSREPGRRVMDALLGFAAGVMVSAAFWSLLAPAVEMASGTGVPSWIPVTAGFLLGALFLRLVDRLLPHLHPGLAGDRREGPKSSWRRSTLVALAITIHNLPEGLVVGVAIAAAASGSATTMASAIALAIGIAIQNIPEGLAVAIPLRREGLPPTRSFWLGALSGIVEPIGGVLGAAFVLAVQAVLPYALAFAAGAMVFVVMEDLVPEAHRDGHSDEATMGAILGFAIMMLLDVALG